MSFINWNDSLSLGIIEIDEQHQELVSMINKLHDAMVSQKNKEGLQEILSGLIDYAGYHFSTEEKYFDRYHYPETEIHKKEHEQFVNNVMDFDRGFGAGKLTLSLDIMTFLQDWLIKHIKGSDKKYAPFLRSAGVK